MSLREKIKLNQVEIDDYLKEQKDIHIGTLNQDGSSHLTTMWYSMENTEIIFHTYTKSQKIMNLLRDDRITILTESGDTYETLKGIMLYGNAKIIHGTNDPEIVLQTILKVEEKYIVGSASNEYIEGMKEKVSKRSAVKVKVNKYVTWDHSKI